MGIGLQKTFDLPSKKLSAELQEKTNLVRHHRMLHATATSKVATRATPNASAPKARSHSSTSAHHN